MKEKFKIIALIIIIVLVLGLLGYEIIKERKIYNEPADDEEVIIEPIYKDLESLPLDYDFAQMVEDDCYIVTNSGVVYNLKNLNNFIKNVENNVRDQVRIIQYTIEGQPIIKDLEYTQDKFILKNDYRRDGFSANEDRIIETTEYDASLYELQKSEDTSTINKNVTLRNIYLKEKDTENSIYICQLAEIKETSEEEFKIEFERNDTGKVKILDASETDKYDYNIYTYKGEVNIIINEEKMSLRDALLNDKITVDRILEKAEKDFNERTIWRGVYSDGGSKNYIYDDYSILKCNRIMSTPDERDRDLYIGIPSMYIGEVTK